MFATYMRRMRNNNLEIRIAGFSYRPQLEFQLKNFHKYKPPNNFKVTKTDVNWDEFLLPVLWTVFHSQM